jgi:hypothetical protein
MEGVSVRVYEIRVKGYLGRRWSEWFDGLEITNMENGEAVLPGEIVDQATLHGVLTKARESGIAAGRCDRFRPRQVRRRMDDPEGERK